MTIDTELARHCLEDLGGRMCPIVKQRADALKPDVCEGLSIRDTLFGFLVQATSELQQHKAREEHTGSKSRKRVARLLGQQEALAYAVALIDNPYNVDTNRVREEARLELDSRRF